MKIASVADVKARFSEFLRETRSGPVIITKALYEAKRIGSKYCLATMCIGGGQGITTIWEMI